MQTLSALLCLFFVGSAFACETFPNGTETKLNWWMSCGTKATYYTVWASDQQGNVEYPIHLGKPLVAHANITNNGGVYSNLEITLKVSDWGGWSGCDWHELPTFGLLNNLNACEYIKCPLQSGNQLLDITVDFSKFQAIIDLLKDNAPYQLWFQLKDVPSGDVTCLTLQARARLK